MFQNETTHWKLHYVYLQHDSTILQYHDTIFQLTCNISSSEFLYKLEDLQDPLTRPNIFFTSNVAWITLIKLVFIWSIFQVLVTMILNASKTSQVACFSGYKKCNGLLLTQRRCYSSVFVILVAQIPEFCRKTCTRMMWMHIKWEQFSFPVLAGYKQYSPPCYPAANCVDKRMGNLVAYARKVEPWRHVRTISLVAG